MQAHHEAVMHGTQFSGSVASTMDTSAATQSSSPCRAVLGPRVPDHDGAEEPQRSIRSIAERPNNPPGPVMDLPPMGNKGLYAVAQRVIDWMGAVYHHPL